MKREVLDRFLAGPGDIAELQARVELLRDGRERLTAAYGEMGGGSSGPGDPTGDLAVRLNGASVRLDARRRQYVADMGEVVDAILHVRPLLQMQIAWCYYIRRYTVRKIADEVHYTPSYVGKLLAEANEKMIQEWTEVDTIRA